MPIRPCPACGAKTPQLLEEPSNYASVWYFRCDTCGHVWAIEKDTGRTHHITATETATPELGSEPVTPSERRDIRAGFLFNELDCSLIYADIAANDMASRERRSRPLSRPPKLRHHSSASPVSTGRRKEVGSL